ncbi:hypothetical protein FGG08_001559 [Glutinoglossum americanum]|uniref:R3H-associated N-terminal domain-containing protein n=1 Tax=Glutinoglossum americanum TaxID=1670608 RepID=A0A9P8IDC1_9PEZI|nr:hypothetical protein FGG08_001559 [Glutinoglossum americanum]
MAIFPTLHTSAHHPQNSSIEQVTDALFTVTISTPTVAGSNTHSTLSIPLDDEQHRHVPEGYLPRHREPLRRDSLKRREALLKGKEGSRRRRRWENDHLLNNPHAQPPLPSDWEVGPTYPRHGTVPYYLAPLWDAEVAAMRKAERAAAKRAGMKGRKVSMEGSMEGKVPRELRETLKRARGAKGLLQGLEEEVRGFLEVWKEREQRREMQEIEAKEEYSSGDEEIVFVGRDGTTSERAPRPKKSKEEGESELRMDKLVCDGPVDDRGATFGRWLVHSIARYYGLRTWSVTVGNPPRREAYVGIVRKKDGVISERKGSGGELPRPLWGLL